MDHGLPISSNRKSIACVAAEKTASGADKATGPERCGHSEWMRMVHTDHRLCSELILICMDGITVSVVNVHIKRSRDMVFPPMMICLLYLFYCLVHYATQLMNSA